ncbi:MAG: D-hexose-6-phosphate mutarotase [Prolixibacteraceae bacterium]|jgi:glucose-6-phosphate 1-epimerase|nr:D-hexose-6-phosphate mutarotase [Prolixibacteraceae bacterium]
MEEEIDLLNEQFSIEGELCFSEKKDGLIFIDVMNKYAEATISLYGGHIIQYKPYDSFDVLWMSPDSNFEVGKAIRGGIPICFPWFGPHASDSLMPAHGFARLLNWEVTKTETTVKGETLITLELNSSEETKKYWPYDFKMELDLCIGSSFKVELRITNTGEKEFSYTSAIHTYFNVSEISNVQIEGLKGATYYSGFGNELLTQESNLIEISKEENRRYVNTESDIILHDSAFNRKIKTSKKGSKVSVVWNPWSETAKAFKDMPDDGYQTFVCIEPANSYDDFIQLAPGENHSTVGVIGLVK